MIYLACPYSHRLKRVRVARFRAVTRAAGRLMARGLHVFSPISHTHPIATAVGLPLGWDYWQAYDTEILAACDTLAILTLDGWEGSAGIRGECNIARGLGLRIVRVDGAIGDVTVPSLSVQNAVDRIRGKE